MQKCNSLTHNLSIGDVVIVHEEGMFPGHWALVRVTEVYPGRNNAMRGITVKTSWGMYKCPVHRVAYSAMTHNKLSACLLLPHAANCYFNFAKTSPTGLNQQDVWTQYMYVINYLLLSVVKNDFVNVAAIDVVDCESTKLELQTFGETTVCIYGTHIYFS